MTYRTITVKTNQSKKIIIDTKMEVFYIYTTVMQWKLAKINYLYSVDYDQLQRQDHKGQTASSLNEDFHSIT